MESLTRPLYHHRRKVSNASSNVSSSSNGLSFLGKDAYDDVFAGGLKPKFGAASSFVASRKVAAQDYTEIFGGKNGTHGSSIPVLDLEDLEERNGLGDFRSSNGKVDYLMIFGGLGSGDDGAMTVPPPYEELFNGAKKTKIDKAKARIPADLGSPLKGSDRFNSSENKKGHSSEPSDQILDGGKQFNMSYHKTGQQRKDGSNRTTHIAQLHAIPGFTHVIDETARLQKTEQIKAMPPVKAEVNHRRSTSDSWQKAEQGKAMPPAKAEVNHNRSSSDCLQKTEQDEAMPPVKAEVNHNRNSSGCPQKTEQDMAMPPVKVEVNQNRSSSDDTSDGKSGRAKWQLPTTQASESLVKDKGECNQDASPPVDFKLFNGNELDLNSHPYKLPPSFGSSANLIDSKGHPNLSKSSNVSPKIQASEKVAGGYSTPFSDEELDVNSAAAASAAALGKAIQQAQESIRIAKEIMERKRDSVQSSKSRSKSSLKAKDRKEIRYIEEADNVRENNVKEACESIANEVQAVFGIDQKVSFGDGEVVSTLETREKPSTGRQAEVETNGDNVEVAEDSVVALWFTQLLNNGKHRMAALASELVGKRNSILQPVDKDLHGIEKTKPAKVTFGLDTTEKVNDFDRIFEFADIKTKTNASEWAEDPERSVDNSDSSQFAHENNVRETQIFAQEDEVTKNIQQGFDKEENCEENLEYSHGTSNDRQFVLEKSGDVLPDYELLKLEEKSFGQEADKIQEDFHVWEENNSRVDEEIDKKQEEFHTEVGADDEPKLAAGCISNGNPQEDDSEERLEDYHKQVTDEPRSTQSVDGEEDQIMSEEEHVLEAINRRPAGTYQNEEADTKGKYAVNSSADQKIEVNDEIQDLCNTTAGTEECAEIPLENLFQEAVYNESLNTAFGADNIDQSANLDNIHEAGISDVESGSEQTSQLDTRNHEQKGNFAKFTEQTSQQEEKAHIEVSESFDEFEGASRLKEKQIAETSFLDHIDAQKNIIETNIQDVSEAVASNHKTANFGCNVNHEAELSNVTEIAQKTGSIHHCANDYAMYNEDATKAPSAVKSSTTFDCTDMDGQKQFHANNIESEFSINIGNGTGFVHEVYGKKQIEENYREYNSTDEPEYVDGLVHESGGDAENVEVNGIASEKGIEKDNIEVCDKERECINTEKELESSQFARELKREEHVETNTEMKIARFAEDNEQNVCKPFVKEEKEIRETVQKEEAGKDYLKRTEVNKRERELEKDRIVVERAIREARERAFAEARERAERAAVEKATAEVQKRPMAEAREKLEKVSAGTKVPTDKASIEAKLRAERAAVERATAEARERALEKALSQKTTSETRKQVERNVAGKFSGSSRDTGLKNSFSSSDLESCDGTNNESAQRRKARLERHQRIMERATKALAEKNLRDVLAQREQAERNRLAETLDADIKRWASGKDGNLRALLSTLQYILGQGSGWQPISLTEIITTNDVKKAYRKATLYVHPDKLQQRGASIQQKYICEKVFDLLKAAWNKFNSEER